MTETKTHITKIKGRLEEGTAPPTDEGAAGLPSSSSGQVFRNTAKGSLMMHSGSRVWTTIPMTSTSTTTTSTSTTTS